MRLILTAFPPIHPPARLPACLPPPVSRVPDECPAAVWDLLLDCLATIPRKRPSAVEIVERLRAMPDPPPPPGVAAATLARKQRQQLQQQEQQVQAHAQVQVQAQQRAEALRHQVWAAVADHKAAPGERHPGGLSSEWEGSLLTPATGCSSTITAPTGALAQAAPCARPAPITALAPLQRAHSSPPAAGMKGALQLSTSAPLWQAPTALQGGCPPLPSMQLQR